MSRPARVTDGPARPARSDGPFTVALVNDYEIVLRGLQQMLEAFPERVKIVELDVNVDVVRNVDIALYDTFSATQADARDIDDLIADPRVGAVVVFSWNVQRDLIQRALGKGVSAYVSKSLGGAELVAALEGVAAGRRDLVVPLEDIDREIEANGGDWPGREHGLPARQAEVVSLITQGLSNNEIALRTHLSMNTVKGYIREAYRTMDVTSRTQAVLWGVQHGMQPIKKRVL